MNLFISWSGSSSNQIGIAVRDWIRKIYPTVTPFLSSEDLAKGGTWTQEVLDKLANSDCALVCLTRENLQKPWIHFEAGSVATKNGGASVLTLLGDGVTPDHLLSTPLTIFQHTILEKADVLLLLKTINTKLSAGRRSDHEIETMHEQYWPDLEKSIGKSLRESELRPKVIRISNLASESTIISDRVFEGVTIAGPAVLFPMDAVGFEDCGFGMQGGDIRSLLWAAIPEGRRYHVGVIGLRNVVFRKCNFENIGFAGNESSLTQLFGEIPIGSKPKVA